MNFREPNQVKRVGTRPGHDGEQVLEYADVGAVGTTVLYTVPGGQVFYLCDWGIFSYAGVAGGYVYLEIYDATPAVWKMIGRQVNASHVGLHYQGLTFPIEIPATYSVRFRQSGANPGFCYIHGWVE